MRMKLFHLLVRIVLPKRFGVIIFDRSRPPIFAKDPDSGKLIMFNPRQGIPK